MRAMNMLGKAEEKVWLLQHNSFGLGRCREEERKAGERGDRELGGGGEEKVRS